MKGGDRRGGTPDDLRAFRFQLGTEEFVLLTYVPTDKPNLDRLTPAERDVLDRMLDGASNARIAMARKTSKNTVANQVASIFRKTGVSSRSELVAFLATRDR